MGNVPIARSLAGQRCDGALRAVTWVGYNYASLRRDDMENFDTAGSANAWRYFILFTAVIGTLIVMLLQDPIAQDIAYYGFADMRTFFGIPNFFDVTTNIPFLCVGAAGVNYCSKNASIGFWPGWFALFAGVAMISFGSGYFHLNPSSDTLVWDRLPMTVGFMGLFVALLPEYLHLRLGKALLIPALLIGVYSVLHWYFFDDLRLYLWIQFMPLLTVIVMVIFFRPTFSKQWMLLVALMFYILAKVAESHDGEIFILLQGSLSGHSLKHLLAAAGCLVLLIMLINRKPLDPNRATHGV